MTTDMNTVVARLDSLERSNRRWKLGTLSALALCGAAALLGMTQGKEPKDMVAKSIVATQLVITDAEGRMRMRLCCPEQGPYLRMFDAKRNTVVDLSHGRQDAHLRLDSAFTAFMSAGAAGASFEVMDPTAMPRAVLGSTPKKGKRGGSALLLLDARGKELHRLPR